MSDLARTHDAVDAEAVTKALVLGAIVAKHGLHALGDHPSLDLTPNPMPCGLCGAPVIGCTSVGAKVALKKREGRASIIAFEVWCEGCGRLVDLPAATRPLNLARGVG